MRRYHRSRYHHPHSGWNRPSPFPWLVLGVVALVVWGGSWWLLLVLFCVLGGCFKGGAAWSDHYADEGDVRKRKRDEYFHDSDDTREDSAPWSSHRFSGRHMRHSKWSHHQRGYRRHGMCGPRFHHHDRDARKHKHDTYAEKPKRDTIRTADGEEFEIID